ncbi:MAG: SDR family oxidoreductase [Desulfobacter sp.]|nr:SDR family oxidoreductase [Desulfobacter sp.]WDP84997.1 MAG: SDR family oxidoreductase [Desulfobacter sp.]
MKKHILITGAGSGIGRATALYFAKKGWFVGLFDLDEQKVTALYQTIGSALACYGKMDVTDPGSVQAGLDHFLAQTGNRLDLLFNSAGILFMGLYDTIEPAKQKTMVDVNLTGVVNMISACLPALKATPNAAVLTMSSASAVYGTPELAVYSATKHGIRGLTEALNIELSSLDIHVGDIMVSFVQTPMVLEAETRATSLERLKAATGPDPVARMVFKAYYKRKVHWQMGGMLKLMIFFTTLVPFAKRLLVKTLALGSQA